MNNDTQIIIFKTSDEKVAVDVLFEKETAWLSLEQIALLFERDKSTISRHIKNVFEEKELSSDSTVAKFATVQTEGNRQVERDIEYYNLDVIISVGYRVKSQRGTQFRIWATQRLKEYLIKGFAIDDERLKGIGGGNYWKELLDRIRDIRSSEKALYRQVLDLYTTSRDYNSKSEETIHFFKAVQNKLHYATNQQTAAEVIYDRANADKEFMGLTTFKGDLPILNEVRIAKNYLTEDELFILNRLVAAFFDLAEIKAKEHSLMKMKDWVEELDKFSGIYGKGTLKDAGKISHQQAIEKAENEYRKYEVKTLNAVEKAYLENLKQIEKEIKKKK
ncbi:MAG: virulence RhuM family protein [Bacteroidetes bacterium]|nr:virulence RhuM family protein [Bacteroidota bacterium]